MLYTFRSWNVYSLYGLVWTANESVPDWMGCINQSKHFETYLIYKSYNNIRMYEPIIIYSGVSVKKRSAQQDARKVFS